MNFKVKFFSLLYIKLLYYYIIKLLENFGQY